MANDFLSQILGSVLGGGAGSQGSPGGPGGLGGLGGLGGALGGLGGLGGMLGGVLGGGGHQSGDDGQQRPSFGGKGAILAMLLPLAMQWVQRNGGIGAVLQKFQQRGYTQQAASWVSTGDNEPVDAQAMADVMGQDELAGLSAQLGLPQDEIAGGMAQILPQVVHHLTPDGGVPDDADDVLGSSLASLEKMFGKS
ncbi:MAG: YidB family protein [Pseudomonadota bacterium]